MRNLIRPAVKRQYYTEEQRIVLGISIMLLLSINFTVSYLTDTYFKDGLLDIQSPGLWLSVFGTLLLSFIVFLNKDFAHWKWQDLGLGKPKNWWETIVLTVLTLAVMIFISVFVKPILYEIGTPPDISHFAILQNNLPLLISTILLIWIFSAFLQEIIFRAFLINSLDVLLGNNSRSIWSALIISSVVFGFMHAWQGISGILLTGVVGFVFGLVYVFNGRRLWPVILTHGILDTITLITIYNS